MPNPQTPMTSYDSSTISLYALHALDRARRAAAPGSAEISTASPGSSSRRRLVLCLRHRQQLEDLAETIFPFEACGLLVGSADDREVRVRSIVHVRNLESRKLQKRYRLDLDEFRAAEREAGAKGREVVGIWHSHPNRTPVPSPSDFAAARRGYSYLILGVSPRGKVEMRSWRLDGEVLVEEEVVVPVELPWDVDSGHGSEGDEA